VSVVKRSDLAGCELVELAQVGHCYWWVCGTMIFKLERRGEEPCELVAQRAPSRMLKSDLVPSNWQPNDQVGTCRSQHDPGISVRSLYCLFLWRCEAKTVQCSLLVLKSGARKLSVRDIATSDVVVNLLRAS
jgi:hypothetical protein